MKNIFFDKKLTFKLSFDLPENGPVRHLTVFHI